MESVERLMFDIDFYKGKRVFITGHTGFKGSWMCTALKYAGADIMGYSLEPPTNPNLFEITSISNGMISKIGDIRNLDLLKDSIMDFQPEIIIHMAAQPIVRDSYKDPVYTYDVNVMGTVHMLEAVRDCSSIKSVINVTTDKVYKNFERSYGYSEDETLDGFDPYSNSKSCSELVTSSYKNSFFSDKDISVSTMRAGNVIGGGDFANDRIVPDCIRAASKQQNIIVRNPFSTRPYQHVLEPIFAYLYLAQKQFNDKTFEGCYNVGPEDCDCITTGELATLFCEKWGNIEWINVSDENSPHEANFLKLDCTKIKSRLGWHPKWNVSTAVEKTVEWTKSYINNENMNRVMIKQIQNYLEN